MGGSPRGQRARCGLVSRAAGGPQLDQSSGRRCVRDSGRGQQVPGLQTEPLPFLGPSIGQAPLQRETEQRLPGRNEVSPQPWCHPRAPHGFAGRSPAGKGLQRSPSVCPHLRPRLPQDPPAAPAPSAAPAHLSRTTHPPSLPTKACSLQGQPQPTGPAGQPDFMSGGSCSGEGLGWGEMSVTSP